MKILILIIGVLIVSAAIGLLLAFPIMWCWNYTLPVLFGIKTITWGQAWCLNFLASSFIKSSLINSKS